MNSKKIKKLALMKIIVLLLIIAVITTVLITVRRKQDIARIQNTFNDKYPEYNIVQIKKGYKSNNINYVIAFENKKKSSKSSIAICYDSVIHILDLAYDDKTFYFLDNNPIEVVEKNYVIAKLYSDSNKTLIEYKVEVEKYNESSINFKISTN